MDLSLLKPAVSFNSREGRFVAKLKGFGSKPSEVYVGLYDTREEAEEALQSIYKGVPIKQVRAARKLSKRNKSGVSHIAYRKADNKFVVTAPITGDYVGLSGDLDKAKKILERFIKTGERPSDDKYKGVNWDKHKEHWLAHSNGEYLGRFKDRDSAIVAVNIYESTGEKPFKQKKGRPRKGVVLI